MCDLFLFSRPLFIPDYVCENLNNIQKSNLCLKIFRLEFPPTTRITKKSNYNPSCAPYLFKTMWRERVYKREVYGLACDPENFVIKDENGQRVQELRKLIILSAPPAIWEDDRHYLTLKSFGVLVYTFNLSEDYPIAYIAGLLPEHLNNSNPLIN